LIAAAAYLAAIAILFSRALIFSPLRLSFDVIDADADAAASAAALLRLRLIFAITLLSPLLPLLTLSLRHAVIRHVVITADDDIDAAADIS